MVQFIVKFDSVQFSVTLQHCTLTNCCSLICTWVSIFHRFKKWVLTVTKCDLVFWRHLSCWWGLIFRVTEMCVSAIKKKKITFTYSRIKQPTYDFAVREEFWECLSPMLSGQVSTSLCWVPLLELSRWLGHPSPWALSWAQVLSQSLSQKSWWSCNVGAGCAAPEAVLLWEVSVITVKWMCGILCQLTYIPMPAGFRVSVFKALCKY